MQKHLLTLVLAAHVSQSHAADKHRSDRRAAIAHEAHMRAVEAGISVRELLHMGRHAKRPDEADE